MILDMIQGCRYLRRSTDRWLLSKNSTTRLNDSKVGVRPVLLWNCSIPITDTKGLYLYPCLNTTPNRLRVQHSLPKLMSRCQRPSRTHHQLVPSLYSGHVITYSRKLPSPSANSPSAEWWRITDRKFSLPNPLRRISCRMALLFQTRPTSQFPYQFLVLTMGIYIKSSYVDHTLRINSRH
jgi:hypothetical protein